MCQKNEKKEIPEVDVRVLGGKVGLKKASVLLREVMLEQDEINQDDPTLPSDHPENDLQDE